MKGFSLVSLAVGLVSGWTFHETALAQGITLEDRRYKEPLKNVRDAGNQKAMFDPNQRILAKCDPVELKPKQCPSCQCNCSCTAPFVSPDGGWVLMVGDKQLHLSKGTMVCDTRNGLCGSAP